MVIGNNLLLDRVALSCRLFMRNKSASSYHMTHQLVNKMVKSESLKSNFVSVSPVFDFSIINPIESFITQVAVIYYISLANRHSDVSAFIFLFWYVAMSIWRRFIAHSISVAYLMISCVWYISSPNRHNDVSDKKNKSWYVVMSICRRFERQ